MLRRVWTFGILCASCAPGATRSGSEAPAPPVSREPEVAEHPEASARALYRLAESQFADGDPTTAASTLVEALDQLPDTVDPRVRHDLETRLTYMQLTAWEREHDLEMLLAARERLYVLLATHAERSRTLEPKHGEAMLGQLFEQLYEVERRLEPWLDPEDEQDDEAYAELMQILETPSEPQEPVQRPTTDSSADDVRIVRVRTRAQQRLDDPDVQARLRSSFSTPGPVLTKPGVSLLHGPRGLVRVLSVSFDTDSHVGPMARSFVREHGEAFANCYEAAFARTPKPGVRLAVSLRLDRGSIERARVDDGELVDSEGSQCLERALLEAGPLSEDVSGALRLQLLFWLQSAKYIVESTGEVLSPGDTPTKQAEPDYVESNSFPHDADRGGSPF